jgi:ABC-type hemin transport system ATPase subunit
VLHEGRVAADGSPEDALSDATLARVFRVARTDGFGALRRL